MTTDRVHGLVLDFDGVVINSEPVHLRASQAVLAREGIELSAHDYYERYVGLDDAAMFSRIGSEHDRRKESWLDRVLTAKAACVESLMADGSPFFPGVIAHIRDVARTVPVAIASGASRRDIERALAQADLTNVVRVIVAAGETTRGKPFPDPYRRAVMLLGELSGRLLDPGRVVAVEDTLQGLRSAAAAGLRTIGVTTTFPSDTMRRADLVVPGLVSVTRRVLDELVGNGLPRGVARAALG